MIEKELLITDSRVLDHDEASGAGSISFGTVFSRVAPHTKIETWLGEWSKPVLASGATAVPRPTTALSRFWPKDSGGSLSLARSPFILNAVLYRPDLAGRDRKGQEFEGELRFIYNFVSTDTADGRPFSAIFEFPLPKQDRLLWRARVHALRGLDPNQMVGALAKMLSQVNTPVARLRTNDFILSFVWDLREFGVNPATGVLEMLPLATTAADSLSDAQPDNEFVRWLGDHSADSEWEIPAKFQAGNSFMPDEGFRWLTHSGLSEDLRARYGKQTCNGCHSGETITRFNHVFTRSKFGEPAISEFLQADLKVRKQIFEQQLCGDEKSANRVIVARGRRTH